jgi:hypothetical protein
MTLTIACTPVSSDECVGATALTIGAAATCEAITGATADGAEVSPFAECAGLNAQIGRWYSVVGNGTQLTVDTCDSPFAFWDRAISVYCGDCGNLFCVTSENDNDTCGKGGLFNDSVTFCSEPGKTYYVLVHVTALPDEGDEQNYCVKVTSGASCPPNQYPSCIQPGDECTNAITVTTGNNPNHSNIPATSSNMPATSCLSAQEFSRDMWYNFTAPATAPFTISLCSSTQTSFDSVLAIYSGPCNNLVQVTNGCNDDGCGPGAGVRSVATVNLTSGVQYKIRIGSWSGSAEPGVGGNYDISITQGEPLGACCHQGGCTQKTPTQCAAMCGSVFSIGQPCPPTVPCVTVNAPGTSLCGANTLAGNGAHNTGEAANGTRPAAGWGNGTIGVMEDLVVCAGGTINTISAQFLDQIGAGSGTLSTYNQILVRIYPLNNQPITAIDWNNPPTPVLNQTFTVGTNATKVISGQFSPTIDVERWTMTLGAPLNLPAGTYGVYFSFPQVTGAAAPSVFIATGGSSPNNTSPQTAHIVNLTPGGAGAGGSAQHSAVCVSP